MDILEKLEKKLNVLVEALTPATPPDPAKDQTIIAYIDSLEQASEQELKKYAQKLDPKIAHDKSVLKSTIPMTPISTQNQKQLQRTVDDLTKDIAFNEYKRKYVLIHQNIKDPKKYPITDPAVQKERDDLISNRKNKITPSNTPSPASTQAPSPAPATTPSNTKKSGTGIGSMISSALEDIFKDPKHRSEHIADLKDEAEDLKDEIKELMDELAQLQGTTTPAASGTGTTTPAASGTGTTTPAASGSQGWDISKLKISGLGSTQDWIKAKLAFIELKYKYKVVVDEYNKAKAAGTHDPKLFKILSNNYRTAIDKWSDYKNKYNIGTGQSQETLFTSAWKTFKQNNSKFVTSNGITESVEVNEAALSPSQQIRKIKRLIRKKKASLEKIKKELFLAKFWMLTTLKRVMGGLEQGGLIKTRKSSKH